MLQQKNRHLSAKSRGVIALAMLCVFAFAAFSFFAPVQSDADHFVPDEKIGEYEDYALYEKGDFVYLTYDDGTTEIYQLSANGYGKSVLTIEHMVILGYESYEVIGIFPQALIDNSATEFVVAPGQEHIGTNVSGDVLYTLDEDGNPIDLIQFATKSTTKSYILPKTVEYVYPGALSGENLTTIHALSNEHYYTVNGVLYEKYDDGYDLLIQYPASKTGDSITINTDVGDYAFFGAKYIRYVTLTDVEYIGIQAFFDCPKLTTVDFDTEFLMIDALAFGECTNLTDLDFTSVSDGLYLGSGAFMGCISISQVVFGDGYNDIGYMLGYVDIGAFTGCTGLQSIDLGSGQTIIGYYAFTSDPTYGYEACVNLEEIKSDGSFVVILDMAFAECSSLTYIEMDDVYEVGYMAFAACENLEYVHISADDCVLDDSINANLEPFIRDSADDNGLDVLISIGAFAGCEKLWYVEIGKLYGMGAYAFLGCNAMESIVFYDDETPSGTAFSDNALCIGLDEKVVCGLYATNDYYENTIDKAITGKDTEFVFHTGPMGFIGDITWMHSYDEGTLYIYGDIVGGSKSVLTELPVITQDVYAIVIGEGIAEIRLGESNFSARHYESVISLILSEDLKYIGDYSFTGLENIESLVIPAKVEHIGDYALYGCCGLKEIVFEAKDPTRMKYLGVDSFNLSGDSGVSVQCKINANCDSRFLDPFIGMGDVEFDYVNEKPSSEPVSQNTVVIIAVVAGLVLIAILALLYMRRK